MDIMLQFQVIVSSARCQRSAEPGVHEIPENKAIERSSGYEEISICPLVWLRRLEQPAWLLPVVASLPA